MTQVKWAIFFCSGFIMHATMRRTYTLIKLFDKTESLQANKEKNTKPNWAHSAETSETPDYIKN